VKYFIAIVLTLISFNAHVLSQTTRLIQWQKTFGGTSDDIAYSLQQTTDGGYVVAGATGSSDGDVTGNHGNFDYWIVKLDPNGNKLWQKTLGGSSLDEAHSIQQTSDGGFIVAGQAYSGDGDVSGNNIAGYWIVKLDVNGNIVWQKTIGDSYEFRGGFNAHSIRQTRDGGYIVVGEAIEHNYGSYFYWIVKLDTSGNKVWQKLLGGSSSATGNNFTSVQQTTDGGYIVGGSYITKFDADGNIVWQRSAGGAFGTDYASSVQQTQDGNYIIAEHGSGDYFVTKLGTNGNIIWQKTFGGSSLEYANSIQQTKDGGYIVAGYTNSNDGDVTSLHGPDPSGNYYSDNWIVKLDANGNKLWQKTLGGTSEEQANNIQQTNDGNYIIAGNTWSNDGDVTGNHGRRDYWIVKLLEPCAPVINIAANPGTSVCTGNKVTFTATITNGGNTPVYQWKKNGINVGGNSKTYVDTTLKSGDSIYCILTSDAACATPSAVQSNTIKMIVNKPVTPIVSIAASPGSGVCTGSKVTFTATVSNGGNKPIYQWKKNGISVGANNKTYVDSALKNGDSIYCVLASNAPCATTTIVNSNGIKMTMSTPVTPAINISVNSGTSVRAGNKVTFTATASNGGTTPAYQWKKNGLTVGTNSNTYFVDTALQNGDSVYCILTSNAACATTSTATSNGIKMTVTKPVTPTASITVNTGTSVCIGSKVTFTATITNGGATTAYQWKKNGINVGTNSKTYLVDTALKNGDSVYCVLTSNAACATSTTAKSNVIKMTVNNPATPSITIAASPGMGVCTGSRVTFTATAVNGGTTPVYQWRKNYVNVGTNSKTYIDSTLKTGDSIYCVLASNASCVTMNIVNSNGIKMTVSNPVTPTVSIAASPGASVCASTIVTFTATITNGGTAPFYGG
jgi:hypothetical protein